MMKLETARKRWGQESWYSYIQRTTNLS